MELSSANMRITDADLPQRMTALLNKQLSPSDRNYVESFSSYFKKKGYLSNKQVKFLIALEDRYSDAKIEATKKWAESFSQEKRDRLNLAVRYYSGTGYFLDLVNRIKAYPNFTPTENQYNSICHNKYFERALENYNAPPKYNLGDLVVFRDNRKNYGRDKGIVGMIEGISEEGAFTTGRRLYKMMILGQEDNCAVEECEIKLYRDKKGSV